MLIAAPSMAVAQLSGSVIFTPLVGAFVPTNDISAAQVVNHGIARAVRARQQPGMAMGATGSVWMTDRLGVEIGALYAPSRLKGIATENQTGLTVTDKQGTNVWLSSAKLMLQMLPATSSYNLRLGLGPAVIHRGGSAFDIDADGQFDGLTDVGAAMSLCTRIALTNSLGLRLRAENFLYQSKLGFESRAAGGNIAYDSRLQNDMVFSIGLQFLSKE
jgi:hypothetical protein